MRFNNSSSAFNSELFTWNSFLETCQALGTEKYDHETHWDCNSPLRGPFDIPSLAEAA